MLNISGLREGVVIDHIKAGGAMEIYYYLKLDQIDDCEVAIIKNAQSSKSGRKDMIKIEGHTDLNIDMLGVLDKNITVNIIHGGIISKKLHLTLPETVENVIRCKNPRCITSIEQELAHKFYLTDAERGIYRCIYCEQKYKGNKKYDRRIRKS